MKRKTATRKLKRHCIYCNHHFTKGEVYYKLRQVFTEDGKVYAHEYLICPKCNYKQTHHRLRYLNFISSDKCKHPKHLRDEVYVPMVGEPHLKVPSHQVCQVCDKVL